MQNEVMQRQSCPEVTYPDPGGHSDRDLLAITTGCCTTLHLHSLKYLMTPASIHSRMRVFLTTRTLNPTPRHCMKVGLESEQKMLNAFDHETLQNDNFVHSIDYN